MFIRLKTLPSIENVASVVEDYKVSLRKVILPFFLEIETKHDSNYWIENPLNIMWLSIPCI